MLADDESDLAEKLARSGLLLIKAKEEKAVSGPSRKKIRLSSSQILNFTRYLNSLLKGGIPLLNSLKNLSEDSSDIKLAYLVQELKNHVEAGSSFKDALSFYPQVFSKLYTAMIEAGEKTGRMSLVLDKTADYLEWQADLRSKMRELTLYPLIVFGVTIMVIAILAGWVLPKFKTLFCGIGIKLPFITEVVLAASDIFVKYWYVGLGLLFLLVVVVKVLMRYEKVCLYLDKLKLGFPIVGKLMYNICIERFSRLMCLGLSSGLSAVGNLKLCQEVIGNRFLAKAVEETTNSVIGGTTFSKSLFLTKRFPSFLIRMVEVGEAAGSLSESFKEVSEFYDKETLRTIKQFFTLLEPLLIIFMGVLVGGISLAVFLPLVKLMQGIGGVGG